MALLAESLVSDTSADIKTNQLQIVVHGEGKTTASFATGSTTLVAGTPLGYDGTNYGKFTATVPAQYDIVVGTAGVFALTVNGVTTADIAYNATKATIETALLAIGHVVTATTDLATVEVVFDAEADLNTVPVVVEATAPTATSSAVTAGTQGLNQMVAIVWPNDVVLDASANATGVVLLKGEVRKFSEIEALVETADKVALKASCKNNAAQIGIMVRGISNINQA